MALETVDYSAADGIARIVLNRPERLNAINLQIIEDLRSAVAAANEDEAVRVIVLSGAGRAFCAGYDLDWGTKAEDAAQRAMSGHWDPVRDYLGMSRNVRAFMSLWESPKPVIAQVHGWCVGGGTDMVLCSDLIYMAEDAQIGYPPARVWGEPTTAMWVYRLGLEHAKRLMLSGEALSGTEAARLGLASKAVPADELAGVVDEMARKLATIPVNQLIMSKLLVNQTYENMGLRSSQLIGTLFDGAARHTPEGIAWRDQAMKEGFREAVRRRDAPWGDYGERVTRRASSQQTSERLRRAAFTAAELKARGFRGFMTVRKLMNQQTDEIPDEPGIYVVLRNGGEKPRLLPRSVGGHFKGQDPTVEVSYLQGRWVDGTALLYVGKADRLRRRIRQLCAFASGRPVGHWGGRLLWQVDGWQEFTVAWCPTSEAKPFGAERELMEEFKSVFGRWPYANIQGPRDPSR